MAHTDISLASVQDKRAKKRVPEGLALHDYACLYICARNPMLYKRSREMPGRLCVLSIHHGVLDLDGVVVSDHNAAANVVHFAPYPEGLHAVDEKLTFAKRWTHDDPAEEERRRKRTCAEVLVPHRVDPSFVTGAFVATEASKERFKRLGTRLPVRVSRYLFFR